MDVVNTQLGYDGCMGNRLIDSNVALVGDETFIISKKSNVADSLLIDISRVISIKISDI